MILVGYGDNPRGNRVVVTLRVDADSVDDVHLDIILEELARYQVEPTSIVIDEDDYDA